MRRGAKASSASTWNSLPCARRAISLNQADAVLYEHSEPAETSIVSRARRWKSSKASARPQGENRGAAGKAIVFCNASERLKVDRANDRFRSGPGSRKRNASSSSPAPEFSPNGDSRFSRASRGVDEGSAGEKLLHIPLLRRRSRDPKEILAGAPGASAWTRRSNAGHAAIVALERSGKLHAPYHAEHRWTPSEGGQTSLGV